MLKTTSKIALALILAAPPSALLAQTAQQPQAPAIEQSETGPMTTDTTGQAGTGQTGGGMSSGQDTAQSSATTQEGESEPMEAKARPIDGQIVLQDAGTKLANDLLGAAVYSPDGKAVGEINDLIIGQNGAVEGVVIAVGGFLGIGEKWVAVEMAKLTLTLTPDGDEGLLLNAAKEDLEAAPSFKTIAQQKAEKEAEEAADAMRLKQQEGVIDSSTTPADDAKPE